MNHQPVNCLDNTFSLGIEARIFIFAGIDYKDFIGKR